jgi:hypothetical protein
MKLSAGHRSMLIEFGLGVGLCGAAYYFGVMPLQATLAKTRAEVSAMMSKSAGPGASRDPSATLDADKIDSAIESALKIASEVDAASLPARNESEMFSRLNALAARHNVTINQLQIAKSAGTTATPSPAAPPTPAAPSAPSAPSGHMGGAPGAPLTAGPAAPTAKDRRVQYALTARATYSDLCTFLGELQTQLGYTIITKLTINPASVDNPGVVSVQISTEHLDFDVSALRLAASGKPGDTRKPGQRSSTGGPTTELGRSGPGSPSALDPRGPATGPGAVSPAQTNAGGRGDMP